jgi:anti-sigma B factor antagonist
MGIDIQLDTRSEGPWTVLEAAGEVDLFTAPKMKERVAELVAEGHDRILVDLERVSFLDSTGLGVLVGALKRLKERDGTLAIVCPEGPVRRVLTITGLYKVFPIYDSVVDATA